MSPLLSNRCCRCRRLSRGRRSGAPSCRRRPRPSRPRSAMSGRRIGRRSSSSPRPPRLELLADVASGSRTSSVSAGLRVDVKCAMISAPSASRSTTSPRMRRSAGVSGASAASSRSSGRMPRTTVLPSYSRSPGRASSVSLAERDPLTAEPRRRACRSARSSDASTMFIAGEPMKPPTNRLTGRS